MYWGDLLLQILAFSGLENKWYWDMVVVNE
jgi:hypothetical protein